MEPARHGRIFRDRAYERSAAFASALAQSDAAHKIFNAAARATRPHVLGPAPKGDRTRLAQLGWRVEFDGDHDLYLSRYVYDEVSAQCSRCVAGIPCVQKVFRYPDLKGDVVVHDVADELD